MVVKIFPELTIRECIDCPYFQMFRGNLFCTHEHTPINTAPARLDESGAYQIPDYCPLEDA